MTTRKKHYHGLDLSCWPIRMEASH